MQLNWKRVMTSLVVVSINDYQSKEGGEGGEISS